MSNVRTAALVYGARESGMGSLSLSLSLSMSLSLSEEEDLRFRDRQTSKREEKTLENLLSNALHGVLYTRAKVSHTA